MGRIVAAATLDLRQMHTEPCQSHYTLPGVDQSSCHLLERGGSVTVHRLEWAELVPPIGGGEGQPLRTARWQGLEHKPPIGVGPSHATASLAVGEGGRRPPHRDATKVYGDPPRCRGLWPIVERAATESRTPARSEGGRRCEGGRWLGGGRERGEWEGEDVLGFFFLLLVGCGWVWWAKEVGLVRWALYK